MPLIANETLLYPGSSSGLNLHMSMWFPGIGYCVTLNPSMTADCSGTTYHTMLATVAPEGSTIISVKEVLAYYAQFGWKLLV